MIWLLEEAEVVAAGGEPKGLVRDAARNACLVLPIVGRYGFLHGPDREALVQELARTQEAYGGPFRWLAGQPDPVRKEYEKVMGI